MKVLILAGGLGTRLYPLTWGQPKSMVPLANRPFLERFLKWLYSYGIEDAVLALSHKPEMIQSHFREGEACGMRLHYLLEETPLGSGGAIKNAEHLLGNSTFLVLNGDIFTDLDLAGMISFHRRAGAAMTISLARVEDPSGYGVVDIEDDGRLRRFVEKPSKEEAPSDYINAGAWLFEPEMLASMPAEGKPFSIEKDFWPGCLADGVKMYGYKSDSYWIDIGTIGRYLQVHQDILSEKIEVELREKQVAPGVWLGEGVEIHAQAKLEPPVIIGDGSKLEAEAEISRSVLGANCIIDSGAKVRDSVLWQGIRVGKKARVVESAIGHRQEIEAGSEVVGTACEERGASAPEAN